MASAYGSPHGRGSHSPVLAIAARVVARGVRDFPLRRYEHGELRSLLTGAGFGNIDVSGDYAEEVDPATATVLLGAAVGGLR